MKCVIVILGGAADDPIDELGSRTPLEAASMPALSKLAKIGHVGTVATCPPGWQASPETTRATILGHDPVLTPFIAGPLQALGLGLDLADATAFRLDLVTIEPEGTRDEGIVLSRQTGLVPATESGEDAHTGTLSQDESETLFTDLLDHWKQHLGSRIAGIDLVFTPDGGALAIDRSGRSYRGVMTTNVDDIINRGATDHLPTGGDGSAADLLTELIETSYPFLTDHEVNRARSESGLPPANLVWPWSVGRTPGPGSLEDRFGLHGLFLASDPLTRGLARCCGWDCLEDAHSDILDERSAQVLAAIEAVDIMGITIDAPGRAALNKDWATKTESLEAIDAKIIAPIHEKLASFGDAEQDPQKPGWRMMVLPDRAICSQTGRSENRPVPVLLAGAWIRSAVERHMNERDAEQSDMHIDPGHELLEYFLRGGLARVR